jgi:hypothetical protein
MIVHLITAVLISVVVILITWAVFRTTKKRMPGFLIPMLVGVTVIAYGIYSEYTWESRTLASMPASMQVVNRVSGKSLLSPWSHLIKRTDSLSVVDTQNILKNPEQPGFSILELLVLQRFNPVLRIHQLVDCNNKQRADLIADPEFDSQGLPTGLDWRAVPEDHALLQVACDSKP